MNFYNYSKQNSPSKQVPTSSRSSVYISPQISVRKRSNPRIQPISDDILKIGLEEDLKRIQGFKPFKAEDISFKLPPLPFRFSKGGGSILQNMLTESSKKNSRLSTELDSESHLIKRRSSIYKIQTKRDMLLPDIKNDDSNMTSYHIEKNHSEYIPYHNFHPYGCYEEEDEERIMEGHYFKFIGPENPLMRTILHTNGYRETGINGSSTILWSTRPFKDEVYKELGYYQKINHFPKSQEIYKRDFLVRKISRMQITHGFRQFDFIPKTFILPSEFELLEKDYEQNSVIRYIIKHQDASKDKDAIITRNIEKIKLRKAMPFVVSHYIEDPFLINGSKFTMKAYVIVTSIHPLRIYIHKEGLLKYPTKRPQNTKPEKITKSHTRNRSLQPPTNSSINMDFLDTKPTEQSILFTDEDIFSYVSSFSGLKTYLEARDKNSTKLFEQIEDIVIKTIISVESDLFRACSFLLPHPKNCFEFLTFEILVDNKLKPWIIDVKTAPCIEHMSPYHQKMEREILTDLLNIINIVPNQYRKLQLSSHPTGLHSYPFVIQESSEQKITLTPNLKPVELLSKDEKLIVEETNIEWERKGNFKRIFPSESVHTYANYFETERPYNNLLRRIAWMNAKNNTVKKKKIRAKNAGSLSDRKYSVSPSPVYRKANIL